MYHFAVAYDRSWDSVLEERRTRDRKVASSNPGRSSGRIFFSRLNFVCWLSFGVRSTPVLPRWHVKDPGHSANSAGGRLHLNAHIPLTLVRALCGNLSGNELTCDLSGNIQPHSFQLAEPLWTDSGIKSGISVLELISNHTHLSLIHI